MNNCYVYDKPIGFFDSGVGGLSVLKESIKILPNENYVYYGDSKNAPYGVKSAEEVKKLTFKAVQFLIDKGVKAIVIACNTATSVAIVSLRNKYTDIPIVGIEPALKPAVEINRKGKIIIMATPMTLSEKKFNILMNNYKDTNDIELLPCAGLVELIESGIIEGDKINFYLKQKVGKFINQDISSVVLGCTHYPFIKNELKNILPKYVPIIDGGYGTAKQLKRKLEENKILNSCSTKGYVHIYNSLKKNNIIDLSYKLINY